MLRVCFFQHQLDLSTPQAEDMLFDAESMRRFARIDRMADTMPDTSASRRSRHLLETHQLTEWIFEAVVTFLSGQRLLLPAGTIVDPTIITAPSMTKFATTKPDPGSRRGKGSRNTSGLWCISTPGGRALAHDNGCGAIGHRATGQLPYSSRVRLRRVSCTAATAPVADAIPPAAST